MVYDKIIECTLINKCEVHDDGVLLVCSDEHLQSIDIRNDFFFNDSFEVSDITNTIHLEDIGDLYKYLLQNSIYINSERLSNKGILVGEEANILLRYNLKIEQLS